MPRTRSGRAHAKLATQSRFCCVVYEISTAPRRIPCHQLLILNALAAAHEFRQHPRRQSARNAQISLSARSLSAMTSQLCEAHRLAIGLPRTPLRPGPACGVIEQSCLTFPPLHWARVGRRCCIASGIQGSLSKRKAPIQRARSKRAVLRWLSPWPGTMA